MSIRKGGWRMNDEPILCVICEHDTDDPLQSHGAIIFEQYTMDSAEEVSKRAQGFADSGKYGRVWLGKVEIQMEVGGSNVVKEIKRLKDVAYELSRRAAMHPDDAAKIIEGS